MEQYWMPHKLDFKNLRTCLDTYRADHLFIRLQGSLGGTVKVNAHLEGRTLDFQKNAAGLYFLIDKQEVFHFPLNDYPDGSDCRNGFSLAYERIETVDGIDKIVMLSHGINPYDPALPEPRRSFLRHGLDDHLLEIYFKGRIHLRFHSWWDKKADWKYWTVTTTPAKNRRDKK